MKAGANLLGSPDDAVPEKPAMQNNGAQLAPTTLSLLGFCFDKPKGTDDQAAVPVCAACRLPFAEGERRHNHHVSYARDWTVPVHVSCHFFIHRSDKYPHLKPSDTRKYHKWEVQYRQTNKSRIKERMHKYNQVNKDKGKKQKRQYRLANKDKIRERRRQYNQANKDKIREQKRKYHLASKDKINERKRKYRLNNKDKIRERKRQYRQANRDKAAEYYQANKDKIREQERRYREANKDKIRERKRKYRLNNKDKIRERKRKYYQANKDKIIERERRRYHANKATAEAEQNENCAPKLLGNFIPKVMRVAALGKKPKGCVA